VIAQLFWATMNFNFGLGLGRLVAQELGFVQHLLDRVDGPAIAHHRMHDFARRFAVLVHRRR
jgi:hypothetical protein